MEVPKTMQAVRFHEHGGPEVLKLEETATPLPGPGEALIQVRACALNHLDLWTRVGVRGWQIPLPHILGNDVAGVVAGVGDGVTHLAPGLECFIHPGLAGGPSPERLRGDDNLASDYGVLGLFCDGGYAQYVKVPAENVFAKPAELSWEETAAFPLTYLTAWHMLGPRRADLKCGETVLVIGANSGVGTAAIQLAKVRGCRVIATAGRDDKIRHARKQGADAVIDHYLFSGKIHKQVEELTAGVGVDVVVEHVGPAVFGQCLKALRRGGRLVTCGATTGPTTAIDLQLMFAKHLTVMGSFMGGIGETPEVLKLLERGLIKPVVDKTFPLSDAANAHRRMEQSQQLGKIVLIPEH